MRTRLCIAALLTAAFCFALPAAAGEGVVAALSQGVVHAQADEVFDAAALDWAPVPAALEPVAVVETFDAPTADAEAQVARLDDDSALGAYEDEWSEGLDEDWLFGEELAPARRDFFEPANRAMFGVNEAAYRWVGDPIADVYSFVLPGPVRRSVLNFFDNLSEPANFVNEVLQFNAPQAGKTAARFAVNTTVGVVGLFDPAAHFGLQPSDSDFGETLGVYGIGTGPYLVIPVLGPTNLRDALGGIVNGFLKPETYFLALGPQAIFVAGAGVSRYEARRGDLDALRDSSVDFYSAMRSAYLLQRASQVREAKNGSLLPVSDTDE